MIDQVANNAREHFVSGFYCAESVLLAVAEAKGIQSDLIPKIATGFCSGMARTGGQCGALSGAILSLGMLHGRSAPGASLDGIYARVKKLREAFRTQFGGTGCSELLALDLGTQEGQDAFRELNMFDRCLEFTEGAARLAMILLNEDTSGPEPAT
jgi:C_GCAxxG_C_C family probable redox protein